MLLLCVLFFSMDNRSLFLRHIAQTSAAPIGLEMVRAAGIYQYAASGRQYVDLISGFNVANIGHSHPDVVAAVQKQAAAYMHLIVYGEFVQSPQVAYSKLLVDNLPLQLNCVYFTNSGTEATEGAMKLSKRVTGRSKMIAFNNSYHGSTQGALSVIGSEYFRNAYRPLLPNVFHYNYGSEEAIAAVDDEAACVLAEPVQAESGIMRPPGGWLQALREQCTKHGTLLIFDEIQSGFGRTGSLWAFQQQDVVPDILLLGKALGGGMPLGAFITDHQLMQALTHNPVLGHITTFGGHPVSCAAGKAALEVLLNNDCIAGIQQKENALLSNLQHPEIISVRSSGLWASLRFDSFDTNVKVIHRCIENGLITDWFLFAPECLRVAPPLVITDEELHAACTLIIQSINEVT